MVTSAGRLVADLRERAGLTQTELARRAGMAQSAISDYERGRKEPSLTTLDRLATAAGMRVDVTYHPLRPKPSLATLRRKRRAIVELCRRHGASNPRLFGSVSKGSADPGSDVDLLVDLERGRTLFDVAALHDDLAELLGYEVDVLTSGALHGRMAHVLDEAVPL